MGSYADTDIHRDGMVLEIVRPLHIYPPRVFGSITTRKKDPSTPQYMEILRFLATMMPPPLRMTWKENAEQKLTISSLRPSLSGLSSILCKLPWIRNPLCIIS